MGTKPQPHPTPSCGARFYKCALQVNPADYLKTNRGKDHGLSGSAYVERVIEACIRNSIQAIAVTDHNSVDSIDAFRAAARPHGIVVFPGFEIESQEGIHLLCLYAPHSEREELIGYLGGLGVQSRAIARRATS